MVDILDMEDIFYGIIRGIPYKIISQKMAKDIAHKSTLEVADYVEAQQTIACANCKGYKFKNLKSRAQAG